jgi:uncharacterized OB-fold protein
MKGYKGYENGVIGRKCADCGKLFLYGEVFYKNAGKDYCYKCIKGVR